MTIDASHVSSEVIISPVMFSPVHLIEREPASVSYLFMEQFMLKANKIYVFYEHMPYINIVHCLFDVSAIHFPPYLASVA